MGAEEDSFGKDEAAAVHTRNRVQEIVGATQYVHRRSGSMLPPSVVEQFNDDSALSEEPVYNDGLKDVGSTDQLPARSSKQMTTFVDIVGRSSSSTSSKDASSVEEEHILSAWSDSNQVETENSDSVVLKSSTPNQLVNSPTFDDQRSKDSVGSSQTGSFIPSYPATTTKNSGDDESWWHTECHNQISHVDKEDNIPVPVMNSVLNNGYNEKKFQSSAKSDRIYRGSNSFSNEEIVEHLRRLDHDDDTLVDNDENSAAVESSIISNILAMDLDGSDDPVYHRQTVARNGRIDSSWNFQNDHSRFSFPTEHGFSNQQNDLISPRNISQGLTFSVQDSCENKDVVYKSQHQASRAQNLTPPGFSSAPSKPPPGFSACLRTEQAIAASSGNYVRVAPIAHFRSPSLGNPSNSSDDLIDLSTIVGGAKSSTNGLLTNSWPSSISSRCSSSFEDDSKNWLFMQQSGPQFSQANIHQHHTTPQFLSSRDNFFGGLTSRLDLNRQSYTPSLFTQQPNFSGAFQQYNNLQETQQLGFNSFLPGYGDYMFQMPTTGDVYTRVFGM